MSAVVHRLADGVEQPSGGEPNEDLIEFLEELLEKAHSGLIVGVAGAAMYPSTTGTLMPTSSFRVGWHASTTMIGSLEDVKYRILRDLNDD